MGRKLSESKKGTLNPNFRKPMSAEAKESLRIRMIGNKYRKSGKKQ